MSIPGAASPLFIGAAAADAAAYQIDRSLRFDLAASSKLTRTPSSAGNRKTWTMSYWIKRSKLNEEQMVFSAAENSSNRVHFYFPNEDQIAVYSHAFYYTTNHLARDPSAWMHLVFACDTSQATDTNRFKIYKNGVLIDSFQNQSHPAQNLDTTVNGTYLHQFSGRGYNTNDHFDGYLAEVHSVDGSQLAASDFGQYDSNNVWQPKAYSGSYGTNGFYLKFANNGSNAALGTDSSGNSNTFTVTNLIAREEKWSNYLTSTASFTANQGPDKAFDNSLSGPDVPYNDSGVPMTWTPPGGLDYFSKVEIYVGGISGFTYSLNGATAVSATINSWNTVATGSGTINTLVFDRSSGETHGPHAIRVDNVVLVDGTPSNTDSLIDTPTNYTPDSGNPGGNYCTMDPLLHVRLATLSNGNLDVTGGSYTDNGYGTIAVPSGKWYAEVTVTAGGGSTNVMVGVKDVGQTGSTDFGAVSRGYGYRNDAKRINSDNIDATYGATYTNGDVIGIALDLDAGTITFYKNGSSQGQAYSGISSSYSYHFCSFTRTTSDKVSWNFGQRPFAYTAPSNHLAVCTTNLPDPTIADGSTAFDIITATGTVADRTFTMPGGFGPDLVWAKERGNATNHALFDTVRGATNRLVSNLQNAEDTQANQLKAFTSTGFTYGSDIPNGSSQTGVYWCWDGGTSTASNTDGSITSNVRANQSAGFSICTYTGNGTANSTVGHGLNAAPSWIIIRNRDQSPRSWMVLHTSAGLTGTTLDGSAEYKMLKLESTNAAADLTNDNIWNPTSTTFKINGAGTGNSVNYSGDDYVAYCWAPVEGYSAFGSYTGNVSTNGPFVYTGFRPRWIMIKAASSAGDMSYASWLIIDTERDTYNVTDASLFANKNAAEGTRGDGTGTAGPWLDILSNGFKIRYQGTEVNGASGQTYIYAAFSDKAFSLNGGLAR